MNLEINGELITLKGNSKWNKLLREAWEEINEKYNLNNDGSILMKYVDNVGKKADTFTLAGGKARSPHSKKIMKAASTILEIDYFYDENGDENKVMIYNSKRRDKNGDYKYKLDAKYSVFRKSKRLGSKDKMYILYLYVFSRLLKTKYKTDKVKVPDINPKLEFFDPYTRAENFIERKKKIVEISDYITNKYTEAQLRALAKEIGAAGGRGINTMDKLLLQELVIKRLEAKDSMYNMFVKFNDKHIDIDYEGQELIEEAINKGLIGYKENKDDSTVTWGYLTDGKISKSDELITTESKANDLNPLYTFFTNNKDEIEKLEKTLRN